MFSDNDGGNDGANDRDVFDDDDGPVKVVAFDSESTDPNRLPALPLARTPRSPAGDDAATGRFDLSSLDDFDGLPSAHISELDISDLDGDVQAGGAETAIMQLPPEMMGHHDATPSAPDPSEVEMRRWSAGRPGARHDMPVPGAPPPNDDGANSTLPALSLDAIRAAAEGLHDVATPPPGQPHLTSTPLPLPPPPASFGQQVLRAEDVPRAAPPGAVRQLIEDALSAVTGAQACAAGHPEDGPLHRQLGRAVAALSQLLDQTD